MQVRAGLRNSLSLRQCVRVCEEETSRQLHVFMANNVIFIFAIAENYTLGACTCVECTAQQGKRDAPIIK